MKFSVNSRGVVRAVFRPISRGVVDEVLRKFEGGG